MLRTVFRQILSLFVTCVALIQPIALSAQIVPVTHREGLVHGFLVLSTLEGETLAYGDLIQVAKAAGRVTLRLVFHFKDGSIHDETTIYSERGSFQLLSYHLIQKGPAFKHFLDISLAASTGQTNVRFSGDDGNETTTREHLKLPADLANGLVPTLLKNISPDSTRTVVSYVAATPKPRIVRLVITPQGEDSFTVAGSTRKAVHYVVKPNIGGIAGVVAPLIGKQPANNHVWILAGEAPAFVKSEGPLYLGGPAWRIELATPVWPKTPDAAPAGQNNVRDSDGSEKKRETVN